MRIRSDRGPKMAFERKPEGVRKGHLRRRWCEDVEEDASGWRSKTLDREEWRRIIEQTKVLQSTGTVVPEERVSLHNERVQCISQ